MLLFRLDGVLLLRLADRALFALLFHAPPRITRLELGPAPVALRFVRWRGAFAAALSVIHVGFMTACAV